MKFDKFPSDLIANAKRGALTAFVGAGASIPAGGPSWNDLMVKMLNALQVDFGTDQLQEQILDALRTAPSAGVDLLDRTRELLLRLHDPLMVAQVFDDVFHRNPLISLLRDELATLGPPTATHRRLVELPLKAIVTTNYDDLLGQACAAVGKPARNVVQEADVAYLNGNHLPIIKMHGSLIDPFIAESVVISRADYDNYLLRHPNISGLVQNLMSTSTLLLVGYSVSDPNFLLLHNQVGYNFGKHRRQMYWLTFDLPPALEEYWNNYGLYPINLDGTRKSAAVEDWLAEFAARVS